MNYVARDKLVSASKIFEMILLVLLTPCLDTTENQFGFKKGHCYYYRSNKGSYAMHDKIS